MYVYKLRHLLMVFLAMFYCSVASHTQALVLLSCRCLWAALVMCSAAVTWAVMVMVMMVMVLM